MHAALHTHIQGHIPPHAHKPQTSSTYHTHIQCICDLHNVHTPSITYISCTTGTTTALLSQPVHVHTPPTTHVHSTHHTRQDTPAHTHLTHLNTPPPQTPPHNMHNICTTHSHTHTHTVMPATLTLAPPGPSVFGVFRDSFIDGHHLWLCITVISIFSQPFLIWCRSYVWLIFPPQTIAIACTVASMNTG